MNFDGVGWNTNTSKGRFLDRGHLGLIEITEAIAPHTGKKKKHRSCTRQLGALKSTADWYE